MKIAVTGDVATQLLVKALANALRERGVAAELWDAPWGQVARQLTCVDSELSRFAPDAVVVWESVEHWWERGEDVATRIAQVKALVATFPRRLYYCNAAPFDDGAGFAPEVLEFNAALDRLERESDNLRVVDLAGIVSRVGREQAFDSTTYALYDMALVPEVQQSLARRIAARIAVDSGRVCKCVVSDCDDTLWGGLASELGAMGVEYGDTPLGRAHARYQQWLKRLQRRGVLLALNSHNDASVVDEVFATRTEMALHVDDFVNRQVNWLPKSANIVTIAQSLNLGLDSLVFLDDRAEQRAEVRAAYPEVCVPELPEDPAEWVEYLATLDLFPISTQTAEDASRTAMYQAAQSREAAKAEFVDEATYLTSLHSEMQALPIDTARLPRVVQLIQRTNQFNLRTQRHSESEVRTMANDDRNACLAFSLKDRFGDFGVTGALLAVRQDAETLFIDTWVTSCRVIGRGLDRFALDELVKAARALGVTQIIGEYLPTERNGIVKGLYAQLGFEKMEDGRWLLKL